MPADTPSNTAPATSASANAAPLMLSISGCRGIVGASLTPITIARFVAAFAQGIAPRPDAQPPLVILARDGRAAGHAIAAAAAGSLAAAGCRVVDLGVATTPTAGVMVTHLGADAGLVITASHNPAQWNGLKPITRDAHAPTPRDAEQLIQRFHNPSPSTTIWQPADRIPDITTRTDADEIHVARVLEQLSNLYNLDHIRDANHTVLVNSINASGARPARILLESLNCNLIHLHDNPSGVFPHTPEPTEDNLAWMGPHITEARAAIAFAQDPDADRLAILDENARYIGEEYTLILAALALLERLPPGAKPTLAANLSTSRMIDDIAARFGATVLRTPVGEANLVEAMLHHNAAIGGEGNGGVIWPAVGLIRDSIAAMALTLALLTARAQPLSRIIADIPAYAIVKRKRAIPAAPLTTILNNIQSAFPNANHNTTDGLRIDLQLPPPNSSPSPPNSTQPQSSSADARHTAPQHAWIHIRGSNTEPIIRLIAEAPTPDQANSLLNQAEAAIN
ncbi:MAG: phosphoglucosamine mutase [Phycisphaerales bacterium]